jgi:predicted DNA-binding transcriptional regulator AlpA
MMLTQDDLEAIGSLLQRRDDELWSREDIGQYAKISVRSARTITALPGFPKAVRLPSGRDTGHPRYYKSEVIEWINKCRERN